MDFEDFRFDAGYIRKRAEIEIIRKRAEIEIKEKWREITNDIPSLHFKSEWNVKIIPPSCNAIARFQVEYNGNWVSVYLDFYDQLGFAQQPYYEIYDRKEEPLRFLLDDTENMMLEIDRLLNKGNNNA